MKTVHGQCHCSAIEFEADVDPERVVVCYCKDCQVMSGSAFFAWVVYSLEDGLKLIRDGDTVVDKLSHARSVAIQLAQDAFGILSERRWWAIAVAFEPRHIDGLANLPNV